MRRGVLNKPEEFNVTIQPFFLMDKKYRESHLIDHMQFFSIVISFIVLFFYNYFQLQKQKSNSTNV